MAETEQTRGPAEPEGSNLEFETLILDLSSRFIDMPSDKVDDAIQEALRRVCEFLDIDLAVLWQTTALDETDLWQTHWYVRGGGEGPGVMRQEQWPYVASQMLAGRTFRLPSLDDFPPEAAVDRENAEYYGIKCNLTVPLRVGGASHVGALGFCDFRAARDWPDALVARIELIAQVLGSALARKRADEALSESEERLRLAADSAGAGLWTFDYAEGTFWATERGRRLFGFSADGPITLEGLRSVLHPDDVQTVLKAIEGAWRPGGSVDIEYRILRSGEVRWMSSQGRTHIGPKGQRGWLMGISRDVTDRRREQEELRASEGRLAAAVELAGIGFSYVSRAERTAFLDRRMCDLIGVPSDQLHDFGTLAFWQEHQHADDVEAVQKETQRLYDGTKDSYRLEYRYLHPELGERWLDHIALVTRRDDSGQVLETLSVARDVTERRRAVDALRLSEARLSVAVDIAAGGFIELDERAAKAGEPGSVFTDSRFRELLGIPPEWEDGPRIVQFWIDHLHPDDVSWVVSERETTLEGGRADLIIEYRYLHPTRGEIWLQHVGRPTYRDEAGFAARTVTVFRDITAQKRAESELRDLSRSILRAQEEERALLARELHDDVSQRLAVLAIEAGRAELTAMAGGETTQWRALREGITSLSEDVHGLAYQLHPSILEELGLVEALLTECERRNAKGGLEVVADLAPLPGTIARDVALCALRIAQEALNNVAHHALATSATVRLRPMDGGLLLSVSDDGVGFDPDAVLGNAHLGLMSMTERAWLVGGTLDLESSPGNGATILTWLPLEGASP